MDKVLAATAHFKYRCGTCQTELYLGSLACISKGNFVFYDADEFSVNQQPYGLFCGIYPSKMKVHCAKCRAKLGYSGCRLCPLDKKKYGYKIKVEALDVVVNNTEVNASTESSKETEKREEARKEEATADEAGHKITTFHPLSQKVLDFLKRRDNKKKEEQDDMGLIPPHIDFF